MCNTRQVNNLQLKKSQTALSVVVPHLDRTWSLSHHLAVAWGNEQMHRHQKCAHSSGLTRPRDIPNRTDSVPRFEPKLYLENTLEPNAGGRGTPRGMASVSVSTCAHSSGPYPAHDIPNRTDFVRSPGLSPFEDLFWGQKGGVPPGEFFSRPLWARSNRCARARGSAGRVPADRWCGTIRPA
jgi:hypothetical protein